MTRHTKYQTPVGHIVVFVYNFESNSFHRLTKPYYISGKDRICFHHGRGRYGLKRKSLGQFKLDGDQALMYTFDLKDQDYYQDKAHFMRCVLKTIARRQRQSKESHDHQS
jgi:hypothetical protein